MNLYVKFFIDWSSFQGGKGYIILADISNRLGKVDLVLRLYNLI